MEVCVKCLIKLKLSVARKSCMSNLRCAVEEHSVGAEAIPGGVVDRTEERMLA